MVIIIESLTPDEAQRKREAGISLKEVTCFKNPLPRDEVMIKTIEESFSIVEDFLKGKSKLTTENWILQVKA